MNSNLIDVVISFTAISTLMVFIHAVFADKLSPKIRYQLWGLIPIGLVVPYVSLPNWFASVTQGQSIQRYIVENTLPAQSVGVEVLLAIWGAGSILLLSYWLILHAKLRGDTRGFSAYQDELPVTIPTPLQVYQSSEAYSPMLLGLLKPKLVIPEHFFETYNSEQQALILEHELYHYQRNDLAWNMLGLLLLALFWFHPLAWLSFKRFRQDQEISCDHAVLARKHITSRINYSKALLVAAETSPPLAFAQLSFNEYGDKHVMFERIKQIKANNTTSKIVLAAVLTGTITLMSAVSYAGNKHENVAKQDSALDTVSPIERIEPKYPLQAAEDGIEGSVVLKFDISPVGDVKNVSVMQAEPKKVFDKVAKIALRQWKYAPTTSGAKNQLVQLDFALDHNTTHVFKNLTETILVTK